MGDTLSFTYTDENGTQTGTYHLAAYYYGIHPEEEGIADALKVQREQLQALTLRLAKYASSARVYRDSVLNPEEN